MYTAYHLSSKEMWRNRGRFFLFSLVIALITVLVLFVAALAEGLGAGNREYLEKLNADLLLYQDTAKLSVASSRLDRSRLVTVAAVEGVKAVGPIGFSSASIPLGKEGQVLDISLIGVEPGQPGEPPALRGRGLLLRSASEAIIDRTVALETGLQVGQWFTIRSIQGDKEEFHTLRVVGISDSRKYSLRPSIFLPYVTWDKVRSQAEVSGGQGSLEANIIAVQLQSPEQIEAMRRLLQARVPRVEAVDRKTAYENTPGYSAQQSTLNTQRTFALLIGVLVIGGFFQIQTLQKVAQIGMLKAIGTPNQVIALAAIMQIVVITALGVVIGSLVSWMLSLSFPPNIPIIFTPGSTFTAVVSILLIGPAGGLVSIRYALRVEPLTALGLAQ